MTRIVIVEDHPVFRAGLKELIETEKDLQVCGEADTINKAMKVIEDKQPDLVIIDITLRGRNGIELIKELHRDVPHLPLLVLSMHDESLYAERAFRAGASGYIMKEETSESIVKAIRMVHGGQRYASKQFMANVLNKFLSHSPEDTRSPIDRLTHRELDVFRLLGQGMTTKDIATHLDLSAKTIGTYRERIKVKLDLQNASDLMHSAVRWLEKGDL
ncbi:MAG: response regulator transcription factor [Desulfobulbaceae bacterium]|nr:response regulator transcription factor [Desulfobulbaceae bacterium]